MNIFVNLVIVFFILTGSWSNTGNVSDFNGYVLKFAWKLFAWYDLGNSLLCKPFFWVWEYLVWSLCMIIVSDKVGKHELFDLLWIFPKRFRLLRKKNNWFGDTGYHYTRREVVIMGWRIGKQGCCCLVCRYALGIVLKAHWWVLIWTVLWMGF